MKKYVRIAKAVMQEMLIYRINFFLWRARQIMQVLIIYYLWLAILPPNKTFAGYDQSLMLTYVFATTVIGMIVYSSRSSSIGNDINSGDLSNRLLKPMNYLFTWFVTDLGDKVMNVFLSVIELIILYLLLKPPLFIQTDPQIIFFSVLVVLIAISMYFFFNVLLGFVAFWSPEVWAPRFIFTILLTFFAGGLFPLDLLPNSLYQFFMYLPFPYLLYFPVKIYLGTLSYMQILQGITVSILWSFILFFATQLIWQKGLRTYTAQGR